MRVVITLVATCLALLLAPAAALAIDATVNPSPIDVGGWDVDVASPKLVAASVSNSDFMNPLTISAITPVGGDVADFSVPATPCIGMPISPMFPCSFDVAFDPSTTGAKTTSLQIDSGDLPAPEFVTVNAVATDLDIVDPADANVDFGNQLIAAGPTAATVIDVTNNGGDPVTLDGIFLGGIDPAHFSITGNTCDDAPVAAAGTCTISVVFDPSTIDGKSAYVSVGGASVGVVYAELEGVGTGPILSRSSTSRAFGDRLTTAGASASQPVTITNTGNAPLDITAVTVGGANAAQFVVDGSTCVPGTIAASGICSISIAYDPSTTGAHAASISIASDAPGTPHSIALSGTGLPPLPDLTPAPTLLTFDELDVDDGASTAKTVTVTNDGDGPLSISANTVTTDQFSVASSTCIGSAIAPAATCAINVVFDPSGVPGTREAELTITSNDASSPHSIDLAGTAIDPGTPITAVSVANGGTWDLGNAMTEIAAAVSLSNVGGGTLRVTSIELGGANADRFRLIQYCTGINISNNGSGCGINIRYVPAAGEHEATLTIKSNSGGGDYVIGVRAASNASACVAYDKAPGCVGPDVIYGSYADNTIWGGASNDRIYGSNGNDVLHGGDGNDALWGERGDDTLKGGAGNDLLRPGVGRNTSTGGAGNDTLFLVPDGERDFLTFATFPSMGGTVDLGAGNDTVKYDRVVKRGEKFTADDDAMTFKLGIGNDVAFFVHKVGLVQAGAGNDVLTGAVAGLRFAGNEGNDKLILDDARDLAGKTGFSGGAGNDIIRVGFKRAKSDTTAFPKAFAGTVIACDGGKDSVELEFKGYPGAKVAATAKGLAKLKIKFTACEKVYVDGTLIK